MPGHFSINEGRTWNRTDLQRGRPVKSAWLIRYLPGESRFNGRFLARLDVIAQAPHWARKDLHFRVPCDSLRTCRNGLLAFFLQRYALAALRVLDRLTYAAWVDISGLLNATVQISFSSAPGSSLQSRRRRRLGSDGPLAPPIDRSTAWPAIVMASGDRAILPLVAGGRCS